MRATSKAKQQASSADKQSAERMLAMQPGNWEVKRPGDPAWISMADPRAVGLMSPPPAAGADIPTLVDPE